MQEVGTTALAGAASLMAYVALTNFSPLAAIVRGLVYLRAVGKVLPLAARAAWRTAQIEIGECLREARREA